MKNLKKLIVLLFLGCAFNLSAAYLKDVPQTLKQPDGTVVNCFATGDEYHHWLHDANGYTIVQNRETGYFVYARKSGDELVPTMLRPGVDNPATGGLKTGLNISSAKYRELFNTRFKEPGVKSARTFNNTGNFNNLVVFVRFSNQNEYTESLTRYSNAFNATGTVSMTEYYKEVSKSQLNITTTFYPKPSGTNIVSYVDSHARRYYQPYSATNPDGYQGEQEYVDREMTLLKDAALSVKAQVEASGVNYDHDNNGYIDNVCFIMQGPTDGWNDLLWPHRWVLYAYDVRIGGARVYDYNFQLSEAFGVSVLCHEMFHSLGSPDLYRYTNDDITPVGPWDVMAHTTNPPQHMSAYMNMKYGKWFSQIPTITADGTYTLKPLATDAYAAYKIASPNSTSEYFVLEYRKSTGRFESGLTGSGLIIYRVKPSLEGNAEGPPDEVYVYRQNGTTRADGNINNATFSSNVGRTEFGDNTNPSDFLSNGTAGGIRISNIGASGETITFTVGAGGALNPPRDLTVGLAGRTVTLTWKKPDAGSGTLTGFKVYRNQVAISTINNANTLTFTDADLADGTWQYHITARYTTPSGESGPSNAVTVNIGTEALPDLNIINPKVEPANVEPGGTVNLSCSLANSGTAQAGSSMLRVYLSLDEAFDSGDRQLAAGTIDPIDPGSAMEITGDNISIPATTDIGNWFVIFLADADAAVNESIENNNQASALLTVGNPALNPPRNLTAQVAAGSILLTWMEPETGGGTLTGYSVYRNENKIATINDPATLDYTDGGLSLGVYTYYLIALYSNPAGESPRSNEVTVTLSTDAKPDLTLQDLIVTPEVAAPGGSIGISCSMLNIGAATAGESEVRLYLSKDMNLDDGDVYLAYGTLDPIDAGQEITISGEDISLPDDLASGNWFALLIVDATGLVDESNEMNNMASAEVNVQGQAPDLQITNMVLFPAVITPTSNVRITFNVYNSGPVLATPVRSTFYISEDEVLDAGDFMVSDAATRILSGKSNIMMYSGFVLGPNYRAGQYFLIGMIDQEGLVAESDETNNLYIKAVTLAATTGTQPEALEYGLRIYPVPTDEMLILEFPGVPGDSMTITFSDIIGREISRLEQPVSISNRIVVDTRTWLPGNGLVRIYLKDKLLTGRFVIK